MMSKSFIYCQHLVSQHSAASLFPRATLPSYSSYPAPTSVYHESAYQPYTATRSLDITAPQNNSSVNIDTGTVSAAGAHSTTARLIVDLKT